MCLADAACSVRDVETEQFCCSHRRRLSSLHEPYIRFVHAALGFRFNHKSARWRSCHTGCREHDLILAVAAKLWYVGLGEIAAYKNFEHKSLMDFG